MIEANFFHDLFEGCFLPYDFEFERFKFWSSIFIYIDLHKRGGYNFDGI